MTHHFGVNSDTFDRDFKYDLGLNACRAKVDEGVVPDQRGNWTLGRAGWCPGWHLPPFVKDVTASLKVGHNSLSYRALCQGKPYDPTPVANTPLNSFAAQVQLATYLVLWTDEPLPQATGAAIEGGTCCATGGLTVPMDASASATVEAADSGSREASTQTALGVGCQGASGAGLLPVGLSLALGHLGRRRRPRCKVSA